MLICQTDPADMDIQQHMAALDISVCQTMKLLPLLLLACKLHILLAKKGKSVKHKCNGIEVRGEYHKKVVLTKGLNRPYELAYYKDKNQLYFSQNVGNDTEDKFELRYLPYNTSISEPIETEVENGFAVALDANNHVAYFGGSNGIFERSLITGKSEKLTGKYNIWDLFYKDRLYFVTYPKQQVYKLEKSETDTSVKKRQQKKVVTIEKLKPKWIEGRILQFVIDGDDDIFIANSTGMFMVKNGTENATLMDGAAGFRALEINNKGHAYFAQRNAIYVPHKHNHTLQKIADVKNIFGLTFDGDDNIIYSNPLEIVKLVPSKCIVK